MNFWKACYLRTKNGPIEYGDFVRLEYYVIDSQGNIIEEKMNLKLL